MYLEALEPNNQVTKQLFHRPTVDILVYKTGTCSRYYQSTPTLRIPPITSFHHLGHSFLKLRKITGCHYFFVLHKKKVTGSFSDNLLCASDDTMGFRLIQSITEVIKILWGKVKQILSNINKYRHLTHDCHRGNLSNLYIFFLF